MKRLLLIAVAALLAYSGYAQKPHGEFDSFGERLYAGGTLGLNFGSRTTQIDIQPVGGLWILPQWNIGVAARYMYRRERFSLEQGTSNSSKSHIWGVSGSTQVLPIPDFYDAFGVDIHGGVVFHCEYEYLYLDKNLVNMDAGGGKQWVQICFLGVGWRQRVGNRSAVNLLVLWDVSKNSYSPYIDNPVLRFSITF